MIASDWWKHWRVVFIISNNYIFHFKINHVDEISMLGADDYAVLNSMACIGKGVNNVDFGGIFMIFVGDFYQLPPARKISLSSCFTQPQTNISDLAVKTGLDLCRSHTRRDIIQTGEDNRQ
jgi:hypothetical protein